MLRIGITLILLIAAYKILQKLGIFSTAESRKEDKATTDLPTMKGFDRNYYNDLFAAGEKRYGKGKANVKLLTTKAADDIAKSIYDAKGFWSDDDSKSIAAFRGIDTKSQLSFLADRFYKLYEKDLGNNLNFMDEKNILVVSKIINSLPTGLSRKTK